MNINEIQKDVSRKLKSTPLNQELSPGSTGRRWSPPGGLRKHREKIHRETKIADDNKSLPFELSKPKKPIGRSAYVQCDNCGRVTSATTKTVGLVCPDCGKFSTVTEVVYEEE